MVYTVAYTAAHSSLSHSLRCWGGVCVCVCFVCGREQGPGGLLYREGPVAVLRSFSVQPEVLRRSSPRRVPERARRNRNKRSSVIGPALI